MVVDTQRGEGVVRKSRESERIVKPSTWQRPAFDLALALVVLEVHTSNMYIPAPMVADTQRGERVEESHARMDEPSYHLPGKDRGSRCSHSWFLIPDSHTNIMYIVYSQYLWLSTLSMATVMEQGIARVNELSTRDDPSTKPGAADS